MRRLILGIFAGLMLAAPVRAGLAPFKVAPHFIRIKISMQRAMELGLIKGVKIKGKWYRIVEVRPADEPLVEGADSVYNKTVSHTDDSSSTRSMPIEGGLPMFIEP